MDLDKKYIEYNIDVAKCIRCRSNQLIHQLPNGQWAQPILQLEGSSRSGILFVFEAPNFDDTYDQDKGYMTCDPKTDPSGRLMFDLLAHVGLTPQDVLLANTVLCLPSKHEGKFPVRAAQLKACLPWLKRLIDDTDPQIIVTCGAKALHATNLLEKHNLKLSGNAGVVYDWLGKKILPLYHPSRLGLVSRPRELQFSDIEALIPYIKNHKYI